MKIIPTAEFPLGQIPPEDWMTAEATRAVIKALESGGKEVRFVGGCVRDALAHRPVDDIDIATPERPENVMELLRHAGIRVIPTGFDHGTVTVISDHRHYEITTLREDIKTDGRHAEVVFGEDWLADARRRDFTINALSATPDGAVYDPFNGIDDLAHGRVRFIGSPDQRVQEDALRILRFFRMYGRYGRPPADAAALASCRRFASLLKNLSAERIWMEFSKILLTDNPADLVVLMTGANVMDELLAQDAGVGVLRMLAWLETRALKLDGLAPDVIRRLASLLPCDAGAVDDVAACFRLSGRDRDRLYGFLIADDPGFLSMDDIGRARWFKHWGRDAFLAHVLLAWAKVLALSPKLPHGENAKWIDLVKFILSWQSPVFPLSGNDVLALGVGAGPEVGALMADVEKWWEDHNFTPVRQDCLAELKKRAQRIKDKTK